MFQTTPPNPTGIVSTDSMRQAHEDAWKRMSERIQNMKKRGILPEDYNEN